MENAEWFLFVCFSNVADELIYEDENITVGIVTSSSIQILWGQLETLSQEVPDPGLHYGYELLYRRGNESEFVHHSDHRQDGGDTSLSATVSGLEHNVGYVFKVLAYRQWEDERDNGSAYPEIEASTKCIGNSRVQKYK